MHAGTKCCIEAFKRTTLFPRTSVETHHQSGAEIGIRNVVVSGTVKTAFLEFPHRFVQLIGKSEFRPINVFSDKTTAYSSLENEIFRVDRSVGIIDITSGSA